MPLGPCSLASSSINLPAADTRREKRKAGRRGHCPDVAGGLSYLIDADIKPTLATITETVYPGKRSEVGGTGFIANWFSDYFSWYVSDTKFPKGWLNHCEQSHYLTFAPIIIPALALSFIKTRRIDWPLLLLTVYILFFYYYIEVGFPEWLARLTLINTSPTRRAQVPFGMANVFSRSCIYIT